MCKKTSGNTYGSLNKLKNKNTLCHMSMPYFVLQTKDCIKKNCFLCYLKSKRFHLRCPTTCPFYCKNTTVGVRFGGEGRRQWTVIPPPFSIL